jgi:hypothetical protein
MFFPHASSVFPIFLLPASAVPNRPQKDEGFTGWGKTQSKALCNKGTALAGPIGSAE